MNLKFAQRLIAFLIATLFIANQTIIPRPFSALLPEEKLGFASDPTITVSYNRGGYINPYGDSQGNVTVLFGADQTFQIVSNPGHSIQDVLVNGGSVGPVSSYTFTNVTENQTIEAVFARTMYSVAVSVSAGGQLNPSGANGVVSIPKGGRIFLIIPDTGYRVSDVNLDGDSLGPLQEYGFENVNSNHTLHADFAPESNNQAPTLQDQVANADMMNPTTLTFSGSDPNNDDLTFSIVRQPDHGSLGYVQNEALNTASVLYVPETNYTGDDSFTIVVNDGLLDSNEATFTVHVTDPCSGGTVSNVSTSAELLTALGAARSCDTILLAPGNYEDINIYGPSIANVNPNYPFTNYVTIASENLSDPATFAVLGVGAMDYLRFKNLRIHHPKRHCMPGTSGSACVPDPNNLCGAMDAPEDCEQEFVKAVEIRGGSSHHIQFVNSELFGSTDSNHSNDIYGLYSEADFLLLDGNDFHDFTRGSVIGGEQIIVRNNYYHDLRSDGLDVGYSKNVIVDSNRHKNYRTCAAQNCADHPDFIQFFADGWDQTMKNVMIRDNVMLQGDGEVTQSILVQSNTGIPPAFPNRNFWIEGNVVYNGIVHGISVADTDNVTIQHNTILTSLRPSDIAGTVAINVQVAEHVLIQNNVSTVLYTSYQINDLVSQSNVIAQNDPARLSDPYHYDNLFLNANAGDDAVLDDFRPRPGSALIVNPGRDIGAIEYDATPDQLTAVLLADPGSGSAPLSVHLDASLSGGPNPIVSYLWDFNDGTFASDAIVDHVFENPRSYQVELTVTDSAQSTNVSRKTIYVNPPPIVGLIYGLTLDGNVLDYSGNQIPTRWEGPENYAVGLFNQSAHFDGSVSGSFITASHRPPLDGMNALTIAFWAKKPSDDFITGGIVVHKHITYEVRVDGNSFGGYLFNDAGTPTYFSGFSGDIQNSDWHHYAITYDGAVIASYVDGQPVGTSQASGVVATNSDRDLTIGKDLENNSPTFEGDIDELKIFNVALSSQDIQALAERPLSNPPIAPSNLHATRFTATAVDLAWDDNSADETEFVLERKDGASGAFQEIHRTSADIVQYTDDTLMPNSEYYFRVKAINAAGSSDYSNELLVMTGLAGSASIYVDEQLLSDCANGDYSVLDHSCTGSEGRAYRTIQAAANIVNPGDTVFIRGGTYQNSVNNCPQAECNLVNVTRSGTAQQPIVFRAFQNEQVVLSGLGFHDEDANSDGQADGPNFTSKSETLFRISGDYIYAIGLEVTNSNRYGFVVRGNYNQIQDSSSHDNWLNGFVIGGSTAPVPTDNSLVRCESHHNRHHSGILVNLGTRTLIEECLSYKNGRDANDNQVLPVGGDPQGGGNSDGITFEHYCSASSPNLCPNNVIRNSITFKNTDDGIDFTFTDSLLDSNISFQNGPNGSKGFKQFSQTPNLIFVGNIAYDNPGAGFELRNQDGAQYYNNFATHNSTWGMIFSNQFTAHNNMAVGNHLSGNRDVNVTCVNCTMSHNWWGDASHSGPNEHSGDPLLVNPIPTINMTFPGGSSISERLNFIKSQFSTAFSLQSTSAAIDAGMQVSYTDPISGQVTNVPFNDAAPDIGAYEYRAIPNNVIYADQQLTENCNSGNYSIGDRSCSGSDGNAFRTIQEAMDHVQAGYHVYVRSGTYPEAVHIVIDGTSTDPIVLEGYNNERPLIMGVGFEDRDLNLDGDADGPLGPVVNQLFIEADYIYVRGFEVTNSTSGGVVVRGSFNVIEDVISHDNWFTNFLINPRESTIEGNTIRNVEGYRSRHGGGIVLDHTVPASGPLGFNQAHTIEDSLFYRNGYQPDGNVVLPIAGDPAGGGNSDGLSASKDCNDEIARAITPTDNLCPNNVVKNNIVFGNADDGFDVSFAHSRMENNISFGNGPRGNRGIKLLRPVTDITFSGNILIANNDPGFELRGSLHKLYNNLSIRNVGRGFTGIATDFVFKNNLAAFNGGLNIAGSCSDCSNNWNGTTDGDPLLVNDAANIDVNLPLNASIQERRQFIINQFQGAYGLQNNSPLIDSGIIVANYHCAQSDDINPNQTNCIHWSGVAPDIGAYEYQSGNPANQPPQVSAGSDVDMTLPTTSTTLNGSVTDDGLPNPPGAVVIQWTQIGGPVNAVIESPNSAITNISSLTQAGTYTFQLSADDDGNGPNTPVTDDVMVMVSESQNSCDPIDYWSVAGENPPIDISSFPLIQANTSGNSAALNFFNCSPTSSVGRWPGYANGQPVNGGLPQLGDLQAHLAAFEAAVVAQIPDANWSGYAVIDFETWHPIWERNSGHRIYIDESKNLVRQAHPDWSDPQIETQAQIEWEAAARQFFEQTVLRAKQLRPHGKWGYYSTPDRIYYSFQNFSQGDPCFVYGIGYTDCQRAISDRMTWLWQAVDVLYPSIYQFFPSGIEVPVQDNEQYVRSMMQESVRVATNAGGREILPYTWSIYHNSGHYHGNFLNEDDRRLSYSVPLEYGVDGIILWSWMRFFVDSAETTRQESNFLQSTLGPYLIQVNNQRCGVAAQHVCSDGLDNDGDELFDYPEDPGCSSRDDDDESHSVAIPQAPVNLTLTALSSTDVYLHWDDLSNEEAGFLIERKLDNGNFIQMPYTVTPNVTQYFDRGLTAGTHYTYRIRAFNTAGYSAYSNEVMFGSLNEDLDFDYYSTQGGGNVCGPNGTEACNVGIDCDDQNATIHPNAVELCDQLDNNCDGQTDEGFDLSQDSNNCGACGVVCGDSDQCNGTELCQAGSCVSQNPIDCSDSVACTDDLCNPSDGSCTHVANNNHCGVNQICDSALGCLDSDFCSTHAEGTPCDDNLFCTVGEVCQSGQCGGGLARDCSAAGDQCHVGVCDENQDLCIPQNGHEGDVCDDGNLCTSGETCSSGQCVNGITTDCSGLDDECNAGVCDSSTGACEKQPVSDGTSCDDANVCTSSDACHSGSCGGVQIAECVTCANDNDCVSLNSSCKEASCNLSTGLCELTNRPDGTLCADSNLCNGSEMCLSGLCQSGTSVNCDDSNACTQDSCDPATGACLRSQISCDDGLACSLDTCNLISGCQHDTSQCNNGQTPGNSNNNSGTNIGTPVPAGGIGGVVVLGSGANTVSSGAEGKNTLPDDALKGNLLLQASPGNALASHDSGKPFYYYGAKFFTDASSENGIAFIHLLFGPKSNPPATPVSFVAHMVKEKVKKIEVHKATPIQSKLNSDPETLPHENWFERFKRQLIELIEKIKFQKFKSNS